MTAEEMVYEIDKMCKKYNVRVGYWLAGGCEWNLDTKEIAKFFTRGSDIVIQGLAGSGINGNWGTRYSHDKWVIPVEILSDPDFQDEFEQEFVSRLLQGTFL